MLTAATIGMAGYGLYSIAFALFDLLVRSQLETWAALAVIVFGLLLMLSAAFVRVVIPGGLALALGALLGLQALSVYNDSHSATGLLLLPQIARGAMALVLVALAYLGARAQKKAQGVQAPRA